MSAAPDPAAADPITRLWRWALDQAGGDPEAAGLLLAATALAMHRAVPAGLLRLQLPRKERL